MTLAIAFKKAKTLRCLFEALGDLVQDLNLHAYPDGVHVQAMDASHVCLIDLDLDADDSDLFVSYECPPQGATLGMHVGNLVKALRCACPDDRATISTSSESEDSIAISFQETDDSDRVAEFQLKLMTVETDQFEIPDRTMASRFALNGALFGRAVKDLSGIGDAVSIRIGRCPESGVKMMTLACDGEVGRASIRFKAEPSAPDDGAPETQARPMNFPLKFLVSIAKACSLVEDVIVEIVEDMPLCVEFHLNDSSGGPRSALRFYLAPKLEDFADGGESAEVAEDE